MGSKIEWTDETWPVVTGCSSEPESEGCFNCYAARIAATRLKHHPRYAGLAEMVNGKPRWTGEVQLNYDVLDQPHRWRKPRMVFVASMGDLFHEDVPFEFIRQVFAVMYAARSHTYQILTKRPQRMLEFMRWYQDALDAEDIPITLPLPNVWLGVTAENQECADERIPLLLQMPAAMRFVSCEPLLGPIDLFDVDGKIAQSMPERSMLFPADLIDWVIVGGESGPDARPLHPRWVQSLRDQCHAVGVPFFFKQWGEWIPFGQGLGWAVSERAQRCWLDIRGQSNSTYSAMMHEPSALFRIGKKAAGRVLDGRTWDEMPTAVRKE